MTCAHAPWFTHPPCPHALRAPTRLRFSMRREGATWQQSEALTRPADPAEHLSPESHAMTAAIDPATIKAELQAGFPGWRVMRTDRLRWWALCGPLSADRYHEQDVAEADTLRNSTGSSADWLRA